MAALNGVKTLDMVGGEITKVEYNGAEYVRVNDVKEPIDGDIALNNEESFSYSKGKFYELHAGISRFGSYLTKSDNDDDVNNGKASHFWTLFRKVSAETTPTVDERVDALEKRVDALEEKPAEPARELKAGDFVTIDTSRYKLDITAGKAYEVREDDRGLFFFDDSADERYSPLADGAYTIVEAPKPTFKEGDIVVITGKNEQESQSSRNYVGDTGKIIGEGDHGRSFEVEVPGRSDYARFISKKEVRHATQAERQAYEESLLKAGDYVKFAEDYHDITAGKAYKVVVDSSDGELVVIDDGGDKNDVIHNEPYEIVKPTPFARAGRKEGEFKVGDVVRATATITAGNTQIGDINIIHSMQESVPFIGNVYFDDKKRKGTLKSEIELITPVESRVDGSERPCA